MAITDVSVDAARTIRLTPLADWVLNHSCSKTVVVPLKQPKYTGAGRRDIGITEWVCLRKRGHRGDCSPEMERGDENGA